MFTVPLPCMLEHRLDWRVEADMHGIEAPEAWPAAADASVLHAQPVQERLPA